MTTAVNATDMPIEDRIENFCSKKGFKCHINIQGANIRTGALAGWIIEIRPNSLRLYHENYRGMHKPKASELSGYHRHKLDDMSIENVLAYIEAHDFGNSNSLGLHQHK